MLKADGLYWKQQLSIMPQPRQLQHMFDQVGKAAAEMTLDSTFFSTIKCPVLVMAGNHDQFLTTERVVNASKMIPQGELAIIPKSTHAAFMENFEAVWICVEIFLNAN
ncbi:MAG: alpha/beta hydrolase [Pedobacter sp.]|nr:MAG: alpha/beta hydrolase [Pedobacter sp.]